MQQLLKDIEQWAIDNPNVTAMGKYLALVALVLLVIQFFRKLLKRNLPDTATRYKS